MRKFLIPVPSYVPMIHLSENTINNLSYVSVYLSIFLFLFGFYRVNKRKKHGTKMIVSSVLLLINPIINLVFG